MSIDVTSIRLPKKDSLQIEHFINIGHFKSKSEFIRYAVKKTINEMLIQEIQEKIGDKDEVSEEELRNIMLDLKKIRKQLWDRYAEDLS